MDRAERLLPLHTLFGQQAATLHQAALQSNVRRHAFALALSLQQVDNRLVSQPVQCLTRMLARASDLGMLLPRASDSLSADERLVELAEILAAGLTRLWARKSSGKSADL